MSLLRTIESRLTALVEGSFGKLFRTNVQPVEIARRLVKEMDDNRRSTVRHVFVPNVYDVYLSREDFRQFRDMQAALSSELAEFLTEHARRNGYALPRRPRVTLHMDKDLEVGSFGIATTMEDLPAESAQPAPVAPGVPAVESTMVQPLPVPGTGAPTGGSALGQYCLVGDDGTLVLAQAQARLGRGRSNDLVLSDSSVSREHAEIVLTAGGGFAIRDLESTNGVLVNGTRVREHELNAGDSIQLGSAMLRFERCEGGTPAR